MADERRRAALAALCVFAVALAATLLPASGFGSQPVGVGTGDPDASGGGGPDPARTAPTATEPPGDTTTERPDTTARDEESTTTATTTATTTVAGDGDPDADGIDPFPVLLGAVGSVALLAAVGFWTGALAVSSAAGPLPVTLRVGGTPVGELLGSVPTRTMTMVLGLSTSTAGLLGDAVALTREVGRSSGTVLGALGRGVADALRVGVGGLAATAAAVPRALAGLGAGAGIVSSLGSVSVPSIGRSGDDGASQRRSPAPDDAEDPAPPSVEEAWQAMRDRVPVRNREARTPGEFARAAAARGYPDEAVARLTDAFREVRYGDLPREDRTRSARSALDRLREYWRGDE